MKKFNSLKRIINSKSAIFIKDRNGVQHNVSFEKNELFITVFIDGLKDVDIYLKGNEYHTPMNLFNKEWLIRECYTI